MRIYTNNLAHNGMEEKNHPTNNSSGRGKTAPRRLRRRYVNSKEIGALTYGEYFFFIAGWIRA